MAPETIARGSVNSSKQRWIETWFEVTTNIVVGLLLSLIGNFVYLKAAGYQPKTLDMAGLAVLMTIISILRQLVLRRVFEHIRVHNLLRRHK